MDSMPCPICQKTIAVINPAPGVYVADCKDCECTTNLFKGPNEQLETQIKDWNAWLDLCRESLPSASF